jgi:Ca2+:H+ antiporter
MIYFVHEVRSNKAPSKAEYYRVTLNMERGQPSELQSELGMNQSTSTFALPPRTIRFADENSPHSADNSVNAAANRFELGSLTSENDTDEEDDDNTLHPRGRRRSYETDTTRSVPNSHQPLMQFNHHARSRSITSSRPRLSRDSSVSGEQRTFARSGLTSLQLLRDNRYLHDYGLEESPGRVGSIVEIVISVIVLCVSSILMSMNADLLVASIDEVTERSGLSHTFIGLIILPIVGNISEYVTVVTVAVGNKLDLAIAVAVGSSIQIALCVAPLIVIAGWILQLDFALTFNVFEMTVLVGTVLLVNLLILNTSSSTLKTSGLKGALMCVCYGIIG